MRIADFRRWGASGRAYAVRIDMAGTDQAALHTDPLLDQIDRGARQFEPIEAARVALEDEAAAVAQQQARLVDGGVRQSVASIARAA